MHHEFLEYRTFPKVQYTRQCDQAGEARPQVSESFYLQSSLSIQGIAAMIKHSEGSNDPICSNSDLVVLLPFLSLVFDVSHLLSLPF